MGCVPLLLAVRAVGYLSMGLLVAVAGCLLPMLDVFKWWPFATLSLSAVVQMLPISYLSHNFLLLNAVSCRGMPFGSCSAGH